MGNVLAAIPQDFFDRHSGAIQGIGSIVLVVITAYYAWQSHQTVNKAQRQIEVSQKEVDTAQEQVRLQQAANKTANRIASETTRARLISTTPVVSAALITPIGGLIPRESRDFDGAHEIENISFDNSPWRARVRLDVTNHGPGPATVALQDPEVGVTNFLYPNETWRREREQVLGEGETLKVEWSHMTAGLIWRRWDQLITVGFISRALVETGVVDCHEWVGEFHLREEDQKVNLRTEGLSGPPIAAQQRSFPTAI